MNTAIKPSLLLIEKDEGLRQLLALLLHEEHNLIARSSSLAGLQYLYEGQLPQLMIVDLNVEDIPALELIQQINSNGLLRDIPMIVLGKPNHKYLENKLPKQVSDFIIKPFDPDKLKQKIKQQLAIL
ncbi:MAG: response regulator [Bacteroidota bacterium]